MLVDAQLNREPDHPKTIVFCISIFHIYNSKYSIIKILVISMYLIKDNPFTCRLFGGFHLPEKNNNKYVLQIVKHSITFLIDFFNYSFFSWNFDT